MKIKIGDKIVECDGNSVIKADVEEIHHPDGRVDVIAHVPCLKIAGNNKKG